MIASITGCSAEVARLFWEQKVGGSIPSTRTWEFFPQINTSTTRMEIYTVAEWEEKFDELFERVENGETIGIVNEDGKAAVMVPANDDLIKIYTELNNEAS